MTSTHQTTFRARQTTNAFKNLNFRKRQNICTQQFNPNNPLGLPRYQVNREKLKVIDTALAWDSYDKEFLRYMGQAKVLGFDCEWRPNFLKGRTPNKIAILQLATVTGHSVILQLKQWRRVPLSLMELMADPNVIKVGIDGKQDAKKLQTDYDITVKGIVDLRPLTLKVGLNPEYSTLGMQKLGEHILQLYLGKSKKTTTSDWESNTLTPRQQEYAAIDVLAAVDMFRHIVGKKIPAFKHDPGKSWLEAKYLWEDLIDKDNLGNILHCDVCLVDVSSYTTMVTHLNGKQHKKKCITKGIPVETTFPPHMLKAMADLQQQQQEKPVSSEIPQGDSSSSKAMEEELEEGEIVDGSDLPDAVKSVVQKATQMSKYHCDLCNVSAMSSAGLHQHMTTAKHQQKLRLLERTDNSEQLSKKQQTTPAPDSTTSPTPPTHTQAAPNQPDQKECQIDQVLRSIRESTISLTVEPLKEEPVTSEVPLNRLSSTSSAVVSSTVEESTTTCRKPPNADVGNEEEIRFRRIQTMYCDLCKVHTTDRQAMVAHLSGKKHLKRQKNIGLEDSDLYCPVCQCAVTDPSAMISHIQGRRHQNNLARSGRI